MSAPDRETVESWIKAYGDAVAFRGTFLKQHDEAGAADLDAEARMCAANILDSFDAMRANGMALADILTDDFIERVVNELDYEIYAKVGLSDGSRLQVRSIVRAVLNSERMHTYRFVLEVKATDEHAACKRAHGAFQPDPSCRLPDGIALFLTAEGVKDARIPETNAVRRTISYDVVPDERKAMRGGG